MTMGTFDRIVVTALIGLVAIAPWAIGLRLPWTAMLTAAVLAALLSAWLVAALLGKRELTMPGAGYAAATLLAWTAAQIGLGLTAYTRVAVLDWVQLYVCALVFFVVANLARKRQLARRLQRAIIFTGVAVGLFALVQHLSWNGLLYWVYDPPYPGTRFGPFDNRNYFGSYMAVALAPTYAYLLCGRRRTTSLVLAVLALVATLTTVLSMARAGTAALGVALAICLALQPERSTKARLLQAGTLAAVLAIGISLMPIGVTARLQNLVSLNSEASFLSRTDIWAASLDLAAAKPLTGWGLASYPWITRASWSIPDAPAPLHAHNEALELLVETGVIGALAAAAFLVALFTAGLRHLRRGRGRHSRLYELRLGTIVAWIAFLICGLTDYPSAAPAINYTLAVLAGLMVADIRPGNG